MIEGGGTLDANGDHWYTNKDTNNNQRPMMLDLLWVDGLTVRDMRIRRPGCVPAQCRNVFHCFTSASPLTSPHGLSNCRYWTVHPCFSNNVRVTGNDIKTYGSNTDGCDPDSTWNVYIYNNSFSTGDECVGLPRSAHAFHCVTPSQSALAFASFLECECPCRLREAG